MGKPIVTVKGARVTFVSEVRESKKGTKYVTLGFAAGETRGKENNESDENGTFGKVLCFGVPAAELMKLNLQKGEEVDITADLTFRKEEFVKDSKDIKVDTCTMFLTSIKRSETLDIPAFDEDPPF